MDRDEEAQLTDFMADNQPPSNGPGPFPPRGDGAHLATTTDPGLGATGTPAPRFAPPPRPEPRSTPEPGRTPPEGSRAPEIKGRIHIEDEVVEKVAGLAAMEVAGVADVGGDFARAIESVRERIGIGNKRGDQGIKAEVKGHEVALSVTIMVEFGHVVLEVARQVQANVALKTQRMLGLKVIEVNVTVDDVRTAEDEPSEERAERG